MEVVILARLDPVAFPQQRGDFVDRFIDLLRRGCDELDHIDVNEFRHQERVGCKILVRLRIERNALARIERARTGRRRAGRIRSLAGLEPGQPQPGRGPRQDDHVVLVRPHHIGALALQHADDLERRVLDAQLAVDRGVAAEHLAHDGRPHQADRGARIDFAAREIPPLLDLPVADGQEIRRGSGDPARRIVDVARDDLIAARVHDRNRGSDRHAFAEDRVAVFRRQGHPASGALVHAAAARRTRQHQHRVRAHLLDRTLDRLRGARADLHHRDHRRDADHNAERGQQRPGRIPQQRLQRNDNRTGDIHAITAFPS